jgi:hypothetical protein
MLNACTSSATNLPDFRGSASAVVLNACSQGTLVLAAAASMRNAELLGGPSFIEVFLPQAWNTESGKLWQSFMDWAGAVSSATSSYL